MNKRQLKIWKLLNLIAITYSIITIWGGSYIFSLMTDTRYEFATELTPRIIQTIIIYFPFGFIYSYGFFRLIKDTSDVIYKGLFSAYIAGGISSIIIWGYYYFEGFFYIAYEKTGGANIGTGLFVLFSPIIISSIMWIVYLIVSKNKY